MIEHVTRLAPSPTGAMHLGNARTFLINYLLARQRGWTVLMRMEDLDGPRVKTDAVEKTLHDLQWLGLDWDGPVIYQSQRHLTYKAALHQLADAGRAYPCICSRKDIELAASAPHTDDGAGVYPNTCRGRFSSAQAAAAATDRPAAWRVQTDDKPVCFTDELVGPRRIDLLHARGDFVVFRGVGLAAYQLAVVVDDNEAGVNEIVRGDDLLESAAMQIHLRRLLSLPSPVRYRHVPLVLGPDGRRLAKRHGDTRLSYYADLGVSPQRMLGLLGYWCGAIDRRRDTTIGELIERFDMALLPKVPVTFGPEDEDFLLGR